MADFDHFEGNTGGFGEEDPVADFMARQKQQLEGIDDDLAFGSNNFAANAGTNEFEQPAEANQWGGEFAAPAATAANDYGGFEGEFEQTSDQRKPAAPSDTYASIRQVDKQRQEPEKIRLWRVEQQERLKKKDEDSEKNNAEWRAVAKKELQDWYKHHDEQLDKKRRLNREAEKEFIAQRDDTVPGHEWERIGRLCDFNPKSVRTQKDVSRMRSILLQLKQTPLVKAS